MQIFYYICICKRHLTHNAGLCHSIISQMKKIITHQRHLEFMMMVMLTFALASCHTARKSKSTPGNPMVEQIHVDKATNVQKQIIKEAYTWLGTPYKYAGEKKGEGVDCSGMVMKVFETAAGMKLPRNSAKQAEFCKEADASEVNTGDLVFFATGKDPNRISHVGIVIDNETFIHASASKGVVVSKFDNNYYRRTFRKFGKVPRLTSMR